MTYLVPNDVSHVLTQWACWISGQVAVPLSSAHPTDLLEYYISDSQSNLIICSPELESKVKSIALKLDKPLLTIDHQQYLNDKTGSLDKDLFNQEIPDDSFYSKSSAMIVYTSGTTSKPKGVVLSHSNLNAQVESLSRAWKVTQSDTILHSLPLHHIHGLINALLLPFSVGGKVIMLPKFETEIVWSYLLNVNLPQKDRVTLYMGVPTIYNYLIQEYDKLFSKKSQMADYIKTHCQDKIRLMVSGSAPLPQTVFQRWKEITGHKLLERYGMTEIGMALSNSLEEGIFKKRLPGFVGQPLPEVQIRITNPDNVNDVLLEAHGKFEQGLWSSGNDEECGTITIKGGTTKDEEIVGNLLVKGPAVFKEYWNRPEATKKEFTADDWFITGDSICYDPSVNSFKILGRNSCDIIKSRGYKISALEIETKLLENPLIEDCAVIGIPDDAFGQKIVAIVTCRKVTAPEKESEVIIALNKWCVNNFANYSQPVIKIADKIPRNQMGKVNKADLIKNIVDAAKLIQTE